MRDEKGAPKGTSFFVVGGPAREVKLKIVGLAGPFVALGVLGGLLLLAQGGLAKIVGVALLALASLDVPVPLGMLARLKGECGEGFTHLPGARGWPSFSAAPGTPRPGRSPPPSSGASGSPGGAAP